MRPEAKVGLIIFAAIAVLVIVYWFLGGLAMRAASYPLYAEFDDVQILSRGSAVRLAGVRIGVVDAITLTEDKRARVTMRIQRDYEVPVGSQATVTSGGLIGEPYIEITPGEGPGMLQPEDTIATRDVVRLDQLIQEVGGLVEDLRGATAGIRTVFEDPDVTGSIKATVRDLSQAAGSVAAAAEEIRTIAAENRPQIASIARNIDEASRRTLLLTEQVQRMLAGVDLRTDDIPEILANAREATASLARASTGLEELATDPQLAEDIRATAAEARNVAERTGRLVERVEDYVDRVATRGIPSLPAPRPLRGRGLTVDATYNVGNDNLRVDLNYDFRLPMLLGLGMDPQDFFRVGLFDVTEDARINLQQGRLLDNGAAFRYGLYASRLGVGYDWRLAANPSLHVDLFGLNDPQLEVRALYDISPRWGLWLGVTDVFGERDLLIGTRLKW
jgi:phospholipid/cholesterol/gamma-HCH transport system substrate-binding protein